jgi:hypothetical protein
MPQVVVGAVDRADATNRWLTYFLDSAFGALAPFLLAKNAAAESLPSVSTGDSLGISSIGPLDVRLLSQPASGEPQTMAAPRKQGNERKIRVRIIKITPPFDQMDSMGRSPIEQSRLGQSVQLLSQTPRATSVPGVVQCSRGKAVLAGMN